MSGSRLSHLHTHSLPRCYEMGVPRRKAMSQPTPTRPTLYTFFTGAPALGGVLCYMSKTNLPRNATPSARPAGTAANLDSAVQKSTNRQKHVHGTRRGIPPLAPCASAGQRRREPLTMVNHHQPTHHPRGRTVRMRPHLQPARRQHNLSSTHTSTIRGCIHSLRRNTLNHSTMLQSRWTVTTSQ